MEFVERQILPRYNAFGESHGLRHVTRVIKNSLRLADVTGADIDMVYVIAAYHDLGMEGPRSIYGKIVAEADRDIDVHEIFLRAIQYGKENDPDKTVEEHWERFAQHMDEKYSNNGYIKLWIPNSPNEKALKELRNIIEDKKLLRKAFDDIWKEMSEINP